MGEGRVGGSEVERGGLEGVRWRGDRSESDWVGLGLVQVKVVAIVYTVSGPKPVPLSPHSFIRCGQRMML